MSSPDHEPAGPEQDALERLLDAALAHVPFDGWSPRTLEQAARDAGIDTLTLRRLVPGGPADLVAALHRRVDRQLARELAEVDLSSLRFSERVAWAVMRRLELLAPHREAVRRAAAFLALPQNAPLGARLLWESADTIWRALGDASDDVNWYTKRLTLAGVLSAALLYWLGDESPDLADTRAFVARRIEDVMRIERAKDALRRSPLGPLWRAGPGRLLERIRPPRAAEAGPDHRASMPGWVGDGRAG